MAVSQASKATLCFGRKRALPQSRFESQLHMALSTFKIYLKAQFRNDNTINRFVGPRLSASVPMCKAASSRASQRPGAT